jgi:hypothetical protein
VSEYEKPGRRPTMEDLHQLMGASTPHFALQLRNRIRRLIAGLPADDEVRRTGEREIARLEQIAFDGEHRGHPGAPGEREMPSIQRR